MTRGVAIKAIQDFIGWFKEDSLIRKALEMAIQALSQEPCDDAINRRFEKIVVEYPTICTYPEYQGKPYFSIQYEENGEHIVGYGTYKPEVLTRYIKEYFIPSVTQKSGKWEILACDLYMCSKCYAKYTFKSNFCPNCGAKMESEEV